jgi:hypothetical protein
MNDISISYKEHHEHGIDHAANFDEVAGVFKNPNQKVIP